MKLPAPPTEKQFTAQVIAFARLHGWRCYHTHDSRRSAPGFPDLVMVHGRSGRLVCAELKVGRGKPTDEQKVWVEDLNAVADADPLFGRTAYVWWPEDWPEIERVLGGDRPAVRVNGVAA